MMLQTGRLTIRKFTVADAPDLHAYLSLPETYRFEPGSPITEKEAERLCAERAKSEGFYAVELRGTRKMIGHLYFAKKAFFRKDAEANPLWRDCRAYGLLGSDFARSRGGGPEARRFALTNRYS